MQKLLASLLALSLLFSSSGVMAFPSSPDAPLPKPDFSNFPQSLPLFKRNMNLRAERCVPGYILPLSLACQAALRAGRAAGYRRLTDEYNEVLVYQQVYCPSLPAREIFTGLEKNMHSGLVAYPQLSSLVSTGLLAAKNAAACKSGQCERAAYKITLLALAARALAADNPFGLAERERQNLSARKETAIRFLEEGFNGKFKDETAREMLLWPMLSALYAWGGYEPVSRAVRGLVLQGRGDYAYYRYETDRADLERAAVEFLAGLGEEAFADLHEYAFNRYTKASSVHAHIALAYTDLSPSDDLAVQKNLRDFYCSSLTQDPALDKELKTQIAFAYGRGKSPSYITSAQSRECLVLVPQGEDPRLVVMSQARAVGRVGQFLGEMMVYAGIFKLISLGADALRLDGALRGLKRLQTLGDNMQEAAGLYAAGVAEAAAAAKAAQTAAKAAAAVSKAAASSAPELLVSREVKAAAEAGKKARVNGFNGKKRLPYQERVFAGDVGELTVAQKTQLLRRLPPPTNYSNESLLNYLRRSYGVEVTRIRSLRALLENAEKLDDGGLLRKRIFTRVDYLMQQKNDILRLYAQAIKDNGRANVSLRYFAQEEGVTAATFEARKMRLVIEKTLRPGNALMQQSVLQMSKRMKSLVPGLELTADGVIRVFPSSSASDMARLYRALLDCSHERQCLYFMDHGTTLAIYSPDRQFWLRIGEHEAKSGALHIHLNTEVILRGKGTFGSVNETVAANYPLYFEAEAKSWMRKYLGGNAAQGARQKGASWAAPSEAAEALGAQKYRLLVEDPLQELLRQGVLKPM